MKCRGERVRTDEGLPLASSARVTRELRVGLEAQLAAERALDLALVSARAGEERAAQLRLDEELRVELLRGRVEGRAGDARVDVVRGRDRVRHEERDDLRGREAACVGEPLDDAVHGVERLGNRQVGRGLRRVGAADEDVQLGRAGAVADADGAGKLDAVVENVVSFG